MLAPQRHHEILSRLQADGGVRVASLAQELSVAEGTIRRDLEKLEADGKLVRTHGGAMPLPADGHDLPFAVRRTANLAEKRAIAACAVRHVVEGDVIALDASSTAHQLAKILPDIPITVVTNALPAIVTLSGLSNLLVISTGGILDGPSRSFMGSVAESTLERLNINKMFLSSAGVDLHRGLSEVEDGQARVKRRMLDISERKFLLVDHSKLGVKSAVLLADLGEIDTMITGTRADASMLRLLDQKGIRVEIASEENHERRDYGQRLANPTGNL